MTDAKRRLISADSHVLIRPDDIRARLPQRLIPAYDDALATQAAANEKLRGGQVLTMDSFDEEGSRSAGYFDATARLRDMDRDGVETEVLYSELSAFRHFHLVGDEWRPVRSEDMAQSLIREQGVRNAHYEVTRAEGRVLVRVRFADDPATRYTTAVFDKAARRFRHDMPDLITSDSSNPRNFASARRRSVRSRMELLTRRP